MLQSAHEGRQDVASVLTYATAHETGHLLLPSPAHSPWGIMRADWDDDDLRHISTGVLQFTAPQAAAIRVNASTCCGALVARGPLRGERMRFGSFAKRIVHEPEG